MHGVHHPSADVDRLYAPCSDGGRGLQQIESTYQSLQMTWECDSGNLHTQSSAWLVALLHSCGGVLLWTTSRRTYTGMHPSWLKVASSKCLKQMRDIIVRVAVLFVCGLGAGSLCTSSIAVSLSSTCGHERDLRMAKSSESFCCN